MRVRGENTADSLNGHRLCRSAGGFGFAGAIFAVTPFVPGTAQPELQRNSLRSVNSFCWHIVRDSNPSDLKLRGWLFCC